MANPEHLERLRQGVAAWNAWREKHPNFQPDLTEANLAEADLRACYSGGRLRRVNLSEANLNRANLNRANLTGAVLGGTILNEAILNEAILIGANLTKANLSRAVRREVT
jgi:uncharacterized protein YjbI with pentapeptide repeats